MKLVVIITIMLLSLLISISNNITLNNKFSTNKNKYLVLTSMVETPLKPMDAPGYSSKEGAVGGGCSGLG